jgi:hypothetical protein
MVKAAMFRVTVAVAVCVPAAGFMEMVPVHVVPPAIPDGLTETVKFAFDRPAVKLPIGERDNQFKVAHVSSDTEAVTMVSVWAVTVRVCEAGAEPPGVALNVNAEGLKVRPDAVGAVTVRVTVADCELESGLFIVIVPVQVVPAVIPD